jgi:hypothetical protein
MHALKFEIYRDGKRLEQFAPVAAMAVGPDSVPIPGEVTFANGLLIVARGDEHAAGVSLLWGVGPMGSFVMDTTRLPPRDKPYNLNVELARSRLMKITQKQEDWNLFDFPRADRFTAKIREAQVMFAGVSQRIADQPSPDGQRVRAACAGLPGRQRGLERQVSRDAGQPV